MQRIVALLYRLTTIDYRSKSSYQIYVYSRVVLKCGITMLQFLQRGSQRF